MFIRSNKLRRCMPACATACALLLTLVLSRSMGYTLTDGNARLEVCPLEANSTPFLSVDDGPNRAVNSGFWLGGGHELPFAAATPPSPHIALLAPNVLLADYGGAGLIFGVTYTLTGGAIGSGVATVSEDLYIRYFGFNVYTFPVYTYNDFALSGPTRQDRGVMLDAKTALLWGTEASMTVTTDYAARYQIGDPASLLASLNDDQPTSLSNSPPLGQPDPSPPGDIALCWQWPLLWSEPDEVHIRITKTLRQGNAAIPEPASLVLMGLVSPVLLALGRRT